MVIHQVLAIVGVRAARSTDAGAAFRWGGPPCRAVVEVDAGERAGGPDLHAPAGCLATRQALRAATAPSASGSGRWPRPHAAEHGEADGLDPFDSGPHEREHEVDVVNHQVQHDADVGRAEGEGPARMASMYLGRSRCGKAAARAGLKALDVAHLEHGAARGGPSHELVGLGRGHGQGFFPSARGRRGGEVDSDQVVQAAGHGDHHGVDLVEELAVFGHSPGAHSAATAWPWAGSGSATATSLTSARAASFWAWKPPRRPGADDAHAKRFPRGNPPASAPAAVPALLLFVDEVQEVADLGHELFVAAEDSRACSSPTLALEEKGVRGLGEGLDRFVAKSLRLRATTFDAARAAGSLDEHEGRHIETHAAQAGHEAPASDRGVVVHGRAAGKAGVVVDVHMPAQQGAVGDDDVAAQLAVVGHVAAGHEEVVVAQAGDAVFLFRGAVDGDALADDVMVASTTWVSLPA